MLINKISQPVFLFSGPVPDHFYFFKGNQSAGFRLFKQLFNYPREISYFFFFVHNFDNQWQVGGYFKKLGGMNIGIWSETHDSRVTVAPDKAYFLASKTIFSYKGCCPNLSDSPMKMRNNFASGLFSIIKAFL